MRTEFGALKTKTAGPKIALIDHYTESAEDCARVLEGLDTYLGSTKTVSFHVPAKMATFHGVHGKVIPTHTIIIGTVLRVPTITTMCFSWELPVIYVRRSTVRFAPIIPTNGLRVLERVGIGYHFALGQELVRDKEYRQYYAALGRLGHFIIVDNGAAERDTPPFHIIVKAAKMVHASEIVMPDVLADMDATLAALTDEALDLVAPKNRMIVPQGTTMDEWFMCLESLLRRTQYSIGSIGIPKHMEGRVEGGRAALLVHMKNEFGPLVSHRHIHLLGVYNDPFQEIAAAATCDVRGIDSGMPIAWAQRSRSLDPDSISMFSQAYEDRIGLAWGAPFDLSLGKRNVWNLARYASEF